VPAATVTPPDTPSISGHASLTRPGWKPTSRPAVSCHGYVAAQRLLDAAQAAARDRAQGRSRNSSPHPSGRGTDVRVVLVTEKYQNP
jgi:hypothetical protein